MRRDFHEHMDMFSRQNAGYDLDAQFSAHLPDTFGDLCPYCRDERSRLYDIHNARKIVGEHVQRPLSGYAWQRLHQEVGCSHPGLDRSERMLNRFTPLAHFFRILVEPALNGLENLLMLPTRDPSLFVGGMCMAARGHASTQATGART